ncbi:DUF2490 domain-containing protein [Cytophagaceae bacterium ABcell3]|nr:DUF2490 domain-containing protein [Cytophagaceae bacterium ABcell3]
MKSLPWVIILICLCPFRILAQNQPRPTSYGQWFMYFGDNKINDRWGIHSEAQFRNYPLTNTLQQTLIRPGVNFYATPNLMLTAGYAFLHTHPGLNVTTATSVTENRLWQQLVLRQKPWILSVEHRYRFEQRFMNNHDTKLTNYSKRIRYRVNALLPLYHFVPKLNHIFINGYNELFVNVGKEQSGGVIDRNRLYFAAGYQFNPKVNFQVGYLKQVIKIPGKTTPDISHNLQVGIFYNTELIKTKKMQP